jgi:hypothetical protein
MQYLISVLSNDNNIDDSKYTLLHSSVSEYVLD